jgi:hypothetical protein
MHQTMSAPAVRGATFDFEGQPMTVAQIHQIVPAVSKATLRFHLAAGRNTREAILNFNPAAGRARAGRRSKEIYQARIAAGGW